MNRQEQWLLLDNFRRKMYFKKELRLKLLNTLQKNNLLKKSTTLFIKFQKASGQDQNFRTKPNNRCLISGRNHAVLKKTSTSRFFYRVSSYRSFLPGVRRYSR